MGCRWALAPGLPTFLPLLTAPFQRCQAVPFPCPLPSDSGEQVAGTWAGHPPCLLVSSNSTWPKQSETLKSTSSLTACGRRRRLAGTATHPRPSSLLETSRSRAYFSFLLLAKHFF